ncbi:MAG TPA: spore germination protein [Clostridiales bacterium]|nr:spore germination protein [Clostridiales bacterium]
MAKPQERLKEIFSRISYKPPKTDKFVLPEKSDEGSTKSETGFDNKRNEYVFDDLWEEGFRSTKKGGIRVKKPVKLDGARNEEAGVGKVQRLTLSSDIYPDITINVNYFEKLFNLPKNQNVVIRRFRLRDGTGAFIIFLEGMIEKRLVDETVIKPLMQLNLALVCPEHMDRMDYVNENVLTADNTKIVRKYKDAVNRIVNGETLLYIDRGNSMLAVNFKGYQKRSVERPVTENVIRGSQEGFTEDLETNITLIRPIIKNKDLIIEIFTLGRTNQGQVAIMYLDGIVNPAIVDEVKRRIQSIDVDFIYGSGVVEELIEDNTFMLFPQVMITERPDRTAPCIMEGKVVVLVNGTPFVMTMPVTFLSLFNTSEDSNNRWYYSTLMRLIRLFGFFTAVFVPGLYVSLVNYHQQSIPAGLLFSIARNREGIPFPTIVEVLLMEVSFELIQEAGIRIPGLIGPTLGIIGALILGQAAVTAKIVSPILIIVVAITGLGSFSISNYELNFSARIIRFFFIALAAIMGFFGIAMGIIIISSLMVSMKSFGVPYLAPNWPRTGSRKSDNIIKKPAWRQEERPEYMQPMDKKRQPDISRGWVKGKPSEGNRE